MKSEKNYAPPYLEAIELQTEKGFSASAGANEGFGKDEWTWN